LPFAWGQYASCYKAGVEKFIENYATVIIIIPPPIIIIVQICSIEKKSKATYQLRFNEQFMTQNYCTFALPKKFIN
jgi:hypothetical protein